MCKRNVLRRYFGIFVDAFIQKQNEKQLEKWKEATKKEATNEKREENACSYVSQIPSFDVDASQDLFFPLCGSANVPNSNALPIMDLDAITLRQKEVRMNYIKHCEVQKVLIPKYDKAMAAK